MRYIMEATINEENISEEDQVRHQELQVTSNQWCKWMNTSFTKHRDSIPSGIPNQFAANEISQEEKLENCGTFGRRKTRGIKRTEIVWSNQESPGIRDHQKRTLGQQMQMGE